MRAAEVLHHIASLPLGPLQEITGGAPPMILSPHQDDESLGCGGFIAACCASGLPPAIIWITDGTQSHPNSRRFPATRRQAIRQAEARQAAAALGVPPDRLTFLGLPDSEAPHAGPDFEHAVETIVGIAAHVGCRAILAPWTHDPHADHVATHLIAAATGLRHWSYIVWGWTLPPEAGLPEPAPQGIRIDISLHLPAKSAAIAAHKSQAGLILDDDPGGFVLTPDFLVHFNRPWEAFLRN